MEIAARTATAIRIGTSGDDPPESLVDDFGSPICTLGDFWALEAPLPDLLWASPPPPEVPDLLSCDGPLLEFEDSGWEWPPPPPLPPPPPPGIPDFSASGELSPAPGFLW